MPLGLANPSNHHVDPNQVGGYPRGHQWQPVIGQEERGARETEEGQHVREVVGAAGHRRDAGGAGTGPGEGGGRAGTPAQAHHPPDVDEESHLDAEAQGDRQDEVPILREELGGVVEPLGRGYQTNVKAHQERHAEQPEEGQTAQEGPQGRGRGRAWFLRDGGLADSEDRLPAT